MSQDVGVPDPDPAHDDSAQPVPPTTGLPEVDAALARLTGLDERPVGEHPEALGAAHETLHRALESPSGSSDG